MNCAQLLFWCLAAMSLLARHAWAGPLDNEVRDMTYVGYEAKARRVFVRTNEPVRYTLDRSRRDIVVLVLDNTSVSRSLNTHVLATQFIDGPVQSVRAQVVENPSASVRIQVVLKHHVAFRVEQNDTELALVF